MEKNCNDKYLSIIKKIDLPKGNMSIKNRYTYYPLYDVDKNSYIRRYRMWVKYRDKCITENKQFVSCKEYGKIINKIGERIQDNLLIDPDGVVFKHFILRIEIFNRKYIILNIIKKTGKNGLTNFNRWGVNINRLFKEKIYVLLKTNKLIDFKVNRKIYNINKIKKGLDIFDDF